MAALSRVVGLLAGAVLPVLLFSIPQTAHAGVVAFSVSGSLASGGSYSNGVHGASLSYVPDAAFNSYIPGPTDVRFGRLKFVAPTIPTTSPVNISDTLTLLITQTMPTGGTASFTGTVSGNFQNYGSMGLLTFTGTGTTVHHGIQMATVSIGRTIYGIQQTIDLNISGNMKLTSLNGFVTPEPSAYALGGTAAAALVWLLRRRRPA